MQKRRYRVRERIANTREIASFVLEPEDGGACPFSAGEYLVMEIPQAGLETLRREYSISRGDGNTYRITVKREPAPADQPDLPPGAGSNWVHDNLQAGDLINAYGPTGSFTLKDTDNPVLLISGGVGLTPLLAMAQKLVETDSRNVWFYHGCENGELHAFRDEVDAMAKHSDKFTPCYIYRNPLEGERKSVDFHHQGLLTKDILSELPFRRYDIYLCGPSVFMQAVYRMLSELNVPDEWIYYEFFGPATLLKTRVVKDQPTPDAAAQPMVTFASTGESVRWDPELENLLDFAEENGFSPDFSCRSGTCSTCMAKKQGGSVEYIYEPLDALADDEVLLCSCYPTSDITLNL